MKYADGGIVSGGMFLEGDTGVELVGKLGTTNRGNSGELLPGIKAAFAPAPDSGKELQPLLDEFCAICGITEPGASEEPTCNPWEVYENIDREQQSERERLINQFAADIIKYFPEWNDKDIAEKKVELSFAYMLGKTGDIQRLETEIETLTDKCRREHDGN